MLYYYTFNSFIQEEFPFTTSKYFPRLKLRVNLTFELERI